MIKHIKNIDVNYIEYGSGKNTVGRMYKRTTR